MRRSRRPAHQLRTAVDCLPLETRQAMLDGIESSRIIVGAYVDRQGGVCPMLAAHRRGERTSLRSFAHAWDRYTGAKGYPRPATDRELRTLSAMLEASITIDGGHQSGPLGRAIAEHRASLERRGLDERPAAGEGPPRRDTGERHRTRELSGRHGWAWLRPFRRLDQYELAMEQLERAEREQRDLEQKRDRELV